MVRTTLAVVAGIADPIRSRESGEAARHRGPFVGIFGIVQRLRNEEQLL